MNFRHGFDDGQWYRAGFAALVIALMSSLVRSLEIFEVNHLVITIPALVSTG